MSFHKNQRTLNEVGGNVMAWLAEKHREEIEKLENDAYCKNCGAEEIIHHLPKYQSNLVDGLCAKCRRELYDEGS